MHLIDPCLFHVWFHDSAGDIYFYQMSLSQSESTILHESIISLNVKDKKDNVKIMLKTSLKTNQRHFRTLSRSNVKRDTLTTFLKCPYLHHF